MKNKFVTEKDIIINNIKFTSRKVDILSCICNGYTSKTIADLLGIGVNTINTHIKHMFKIVDCYSRDQLVRFCQRFPEYERLQKRYNEIILFYEFEKILQKIKKLKLKDKYIFHVFGKSNIMDSVLIKAMKASGINIKISYVASEGCIDTQNEYVNVVCLEKTVNAENWQNRYAVLVVNNEELLTLNNKCNDKYLMHINALKSLISKEAKNILENFEKNILQTIKIESIDTPVYTFNNSSKSNIKTLYVLILSFVIVCCGSYKIFCYLLKNRVIYTNITQVNEEQMIVRSDLLDKIRESISKQDLVKYVVLTGVGGAGKTTLARQFLSNGTFKLKWEINSETDQNIFNSFFELAENIADSKEKREQLLSAKSVPNILERRKRIISFIISELRKIDNWCLLFDNVDDIETIKQCLPKETCGQGVVLITTRNDHIKYSGKISKLSSITVGVLSGEEQFNLFCRILYGAVDLNAKQISEIREFLDKIPPLPLDVSAAAYYIRYTESSFGDYINNIHSNCEGFDNVQMRISLENMEYGKTRLGIVISNFKKILQDNEEFKDLLLMVCLLDSQNISIDYLKKYKPNFVVDDFIYHLKKYSLIETRNNTIFIHRNTQEIGLNYLISNLKDYSLKEKLDRIVTILTPYDLLCSKWYPAGKSTIDYKVKMRSLPHIESILRRLPNIARGKDLDRLKTRLMLAQVYLYADVKSTSFIKKLANSVLALNANNDYITDIDTAVLLLQTTDSCFESNIGEESKKYAEHCISICGRHKELSYLKAICLSYLARYYFFYVDKNKGRDFLDKAIEILDDLKNIDLLKIAYSHVYIQYGICYSGYYLDKEESIKSISLMKEALSKLDADVWFHKQKTQQLNISNAIIVSELRFNMFKMNNTINKYEKALECADEINFLYDYEEKNGAVLKLKRAIFDMQKARTLLRLNKAKESYDCIDQAIKICLEIDPSNLSLLLGYVYKAEAAIRTGKYKVGYEASILALKQKENNHNYADLVDTVCYYNMAVSKYKEKDIQVALILFKDFLERAKEFCNSNLREDQFNTLQDSKTFDFISDINICLDKSKKIFTAIYSEKHPFVSDYVYKN